MENIYVVNDVNTAEDLANLGGCGESTEFSFFTIGGQNATHKIEKPRK